jgi:hypothetical protein
MKYPTKRAMQLRETFARPDTQFRRRDVDGGVKPGYDGVAWFAVSLSQV